MTCTYNGRPIQIMMNVCMYVRSYISYSNRQLYRTTLSQNWLTGWPLGFRGISPVTALSVRPTINQWTWSSGFASFFAQHFLGLSWICWFFFSILSRLSWICKFFFSTLSWLSWICYIVFLFNIILIILDFQLLIKWTNTLTKGLNLYLK